MSLFEYVLGLITVVVGLGVTNNLKVIAGLQLKSTELENWVSLAWLASGIFLLMDMWMVLWSQSTRSEWSPIELVIWVLPPSILFLVGALAGESERNRYVPYVLLAWVSSILINANYLFDIDLFGKTHTNLFFASVLLVATVILKNSNSRLILAGVFCIWSIYFFFDSPTLQPRL